MPIDSDPPTSTLPQIGASLTFAPHLDPSRGLRLSREGAWIGGILSGWTVLVLVLVRRYDSLAPDDLFITYRYARNLLEGTGLVYNPGEAVFGLSNPGFALLLAALSGLLSVEIPRLATVLTGASLIGLTGLLLREARERRALPEAALGGTLLLGSSYVWVCQGGAAPVVLLLLAAAATVVGQRPALAGGLAAAAVWCRPDALVGAALLGLLMMVETRRLPWRYGLVSIGGVLAGLAIAAAHFETALPITLESKRLLADLANGRGQGWDFWAQGLRTWERHGGGLALVLAIFGIVGQVPLFRRSGLAGRLIVLYSATLAVAYPLLGVPFFNWYTIPTAAAILLGVPYFAIALGRRLAPLLGPPAQDRTIAALAALLLLAPLVETFAEGSLRAHRRFSWPERLVAYRQAGEWIEANTGPDERVAMTEIGVVGYYTRRNVQDLMGLITPESQGWMERRNILGAVKAAPPDVILWHGPQSRLDGLRKIPWFQERYREAARFPTKQPAFEILIYRRKGLSSPTSQT